jgi:hypothetical protein
MQSRVTPKPLGVPGGVSVTSNNLEDGWCKELSGATLTCFHDLFNGVAQGVTQGESGVVGSDFRQVAIVANMISDSVVIQILVLLRDSRMAFANFERLQNGATVLFPTAQVVDFT